jgi:hypothetical protein
LLEAKLAVRRWDDLAKVPKCVVPPLEAYEEVAFQCLLGEYIFNREPERILNNL